MKLQLPFFIWHWRLHRRLRKSEDCHWCMFCHRSIR
jgi:hypothetical protein